MSESFLVAVGERATYAQLGWATCRAADSAFASAVAELVAYSTEVAAADAVLDGEHQASVEERLEEIQESILQAVDAAFDEQKQRMSLETLTVLDKAAAASVPWDEIFRDEELSQLIAAIGLPDGVRKKRDVSALRSYIMSRHRAGSVDGLRAKELNKARHSASSWVHLHSKRYKAAVVRAEAIRRTALETHCAALAQSDHVPIRCMATGLVHAIHEKEQQGARVISQHDASFGAGPAAMHETEVRVASLNVQEHCRDGVNTYVGALPVPKKSGAATLLLDAMTSPKVVRQQQADVVAFLADELGQRGTCAVCLQEVSCELLQAVRAAAARATPPWHVHASSNAGDRPAAAGACVAATCIVASRPFLREADVTTEIKLRSGKGKRRCFAAVTFAPSEGADVGEPKAQAETALTLVSVHVRHDERSSVRQQSPYALHESEQQTNLSHIRMAQRAIVEQFMERLASCGSVLAVGDWNGTLPPCENWHRDLLYDRVGRRLSEQCAWPEGPTQYGTPCAIDGAILWTLSRRQLETNAVDGHHPPLKVGNCNLVCTALSHPKATLGEVGGKVGGEVGGEVRGEDS